MKTCKKIALLAIIFILSTVLNVYATGETAEIALNSDVTSAKVGETVTITVSAKTVAGVEGFDATLEYDKTKLELTNSEQLAVSGYTSMSGVDETTGKFKLSVLYTGSGETPTEANIATLTFKVLNAVTVDEVLSVKLTNIEVGDSNDDWMTVEDTEVTLTVVEGSNPDPDPDLDTDTDLELDTDQNSDLDQNPKDDTTADKEFNKAGLETFGLIGLVAIVVVTVLYVKYKKYSDVK